MKELSIEEKAKLYDEALIRGSRLWESNMITRENYEYIFPELKESEDERIRKAIIATIHLYYGEPLEDEAKEMIAWLEKQSEQNHAWSEEDEKGLGDALWCCKQAASIAKDENDMGNVWFAENWLKSLKDRVLPQPKQEWSEEDDEMLDSIIEEVRYIGDFPDYPTKEENELYDECLSKVEWLKSLKDRVQPQNTWKPSDKQIKVCKEVYADLLSAKGFDLGTINSELNRMEQQLKKLREE